MFNFYSKTTENEAKYQIDDTVLEDINLNKYDKFDMDLPDYNGNFNEFRFEKNSWIPNEILVSKQGISNEVTMKKSLYTSYKVSVSGSTVGGFAIGDNFIIGIFNSNDELNKLIKTEENIYSTYRADLEGNEITCETLIPPSSASTQNTSNIEPVLNTITNIDGETLSTGYCVNMVYDIPYNSYETIVNTGGNSQGFAEIQNLFLNIVYNIEFNGLINFNIVAVVEWENNDPWDLVNQDYPSTTNQYLINIGVYYVNNGNTLIPNIEYNHIYQINKNGFGYSTPVSSGLMGINWADAVYRNNSNPNTYYIAGASFNHNVTEPYVLSANTSSLLDIKVFAHEIGHGMGMAHLFDPLSAGWENMTVIDECIGINCDENCNTIMSYCNVSSSVFSLSFREERKNDTLQTLADIGSHMICYVSDTGGPTDLSKYINSYMSANYWNGTSNFNTYRNTEDIIKWINWTGWTSNDIMSKIITNSVSENNITFNISESEINEGNNQLFFIIPYSLFSLNNTGCRKNVRLRRINYTGSGFQVFVNECGGSTYGKLYYTEYFTIPECIEIDSISTSFYEIVNEGLPCVSFDNVNINGINYPIDKRLKTVSFYYDGDVIPQDHYVLLTQEGLTKIKENISVTLNSESEYQTSSYLEICDPPSSSEGLPIGSFNDSHDNPLFIIGETYELLSNETPSAYIIPSGEDLNGEEYNGKCYTAIHRISGDFIVLGSTSNNFSIKDCSDNNCV